MTENKEESKEKNIICVDLAWEGDNWRARYVGFSLILRALEDQGINAEVDARESLRNMGRICVFVEDTKVVNLKRLARYIQDVKFIIDRQPIKCRPFSLYTTAPHLVKCEFVDSIDIGISCCFTFDKGYILPK